MNDEDNKFTWNDLVIVKNNAPEYFHPGELASVCGMEKIKFEEFAKECHAKVGDWVYTVEFGDGSSIELPECYLELYEEGAT